MKKTVFSLFIIASLIFQIIMPISAFAADAPDNLTGQTAYLVVHETDGVYAQTGGPSLLTIKMPDGTEILPVNNTYTNIPDGSTISLTYAFHLEDGDNQGTLYSYSDNNFFDIVMPEGISFNTPSGDDANIYAVDAVTSETWLLGTWSFTDANTIRINFSEEAANHNGIWGSISIDGTFDDDTGGYGTESRMTFGTQEVTFIREITPIDISLEKNGVYDAETNEITWTITATPPTDVSLEGYSLVDTYSANQTYKPGSFYAGTTNVDDSALDLAVTDQISYTFPSDSFGSQTITYKTTPDSFSEETGTNSNSKSSTFTNTALVKAGSETITDPVQAEVDINWIAKTGEIVDTTDDSIILKWEVDITVPDGSTITGAVINDTIPKGHLLIEDTFYPVAVSFNGAAPQSVYSGAGAGTYSYSYVDIDTPSPLEYRFPEIAGVDGQLSGTSKLTYYTQVVDLENYLKNNASIEAINDATFNYNEMPDSSNPPGDTVGVTIAPSGGLITKTGGPSEHYVYPGNIHWKIHIDDNGVSLQDAEMSDTIPQGQRLLIDADHPFTIKESASGTILLQTTTPTATPNLESDDGFINHFRTIGTFSIAYDVDYYTEIVDVDPSSTEDTAGLDTLYSNGSINFTNHVVGSEPGTDDVIVDSTKGYWSHLLEKRVYESYDYTEHTVGWQIVVNRNQMPLTNAITDMLPSGMTLLIDDSHPFEVHKRGVSDPIATSPTTGESGSSSFEYDFGDIDDQYTITFYTFLSDEMLQTQWVGNKSFVNTCSLTADEIDGSIDTSASVSVKNPVILKSFEYEENSDHIDWSIVINTGKLTLHDASVTDILPEELHYEEDSGKLYIVEVATNGTVEPASDGTLVTNGYSVDNPTPENNNTLTVMLPDNSDNTYRFEFSTHIIPDDLDIVNKVSLSGSSGSPTGEAESGRISIDDLWSNGGSGSYSITIHKEDDSGNPVSGAEYQLYNFIMNPIIRDNSPLKAITDENGDAVFINLPDWVFYVKEISAPEGYLVNTEIIGGNHLLGNVTYQTSDSLARGNISFTKTALDGSLLDGGVFTLTGTDYLGSEVTLTSESIAGVVSFIDMPLGSYTIHETVAPEGYELSSTEISAVVSYNDDSTDVIVTLTPDTLINSPIPTSTPAPTPTSTLAPTLPQTGDDNSRMIGLIILIIGVIGFGLFTVIRYKNKTVIEWVAALKNKRNAKK